MRQEWFEASGGGLDAIHVVTRMSRKSQRYSGSLYIPLPSSFAALEIAGIF
jgi:hypothetical protein